MQQIKGLQVLRGIAACAVVYSHAYDRALRAWGPEVENHSAILTLHAVPWVGYSGVDLFFILSGFLMAHLHALQFGQRGVAGAFLKRRLARIVPLYWALTAAGLALLYLAPALFTYHTSREWPYVAGSFLFVPWPTSYGFSVPILGAGWTLDYEMYFYVLFASALLLRRGLLVLCGFLVISVIAGYTLHPSHPWAALVTGPLLLEFLMGIITAQISRIKPPSWLPRLCIVVPVLWLAATAYYPLVQIRVFGWGLPFALLVAGVVWMNFQRGRLLVLLGDASYSIYLFQVFALPAIAIALRATRIPAALPVDLGVALLWVLTCAVGVGCWAFLERPLTTRVKAWLRPRETTQAVKA